MNVLSAIPAPDVSDLQAQIEEWGLETAHERLVKRSQSSFEALRAFHDSITPRLEEIITFLNQFSVAEIPNEHLKIAYTALAILEVDDAVNLWKKPNLDLSDDPRRWTTKSSFYATNT